jgi:hypothetical protein
LGGARHDGRGFEEKDNEVLSDIIGRLGLADVAEFGLRWQRLQRVSLSTRVPRESDRIERMK